jgi:hypothetical protein
MMETAQTTDGFLRHAGRDFLIVLYTAFRSLKLYPIENTQVQKALDDLAATTKQLLDVERELEIRLQGEFIFVNSTRLRLDLDNYASFSHILNVLQQCGIGAVRIDEGVDRRQLQVFVSLLLAYAAKEAAARGGRGCRSRRTTKGSRQAHVRALGGGDEGSHQQHSHGPHREREEGQARGAGDRGPGAQQRVVARRADDPA